MGTNPAGRSEANGSLVLIGTPIGNLGDISPRAVGALASLDALACEDTRRTGRLLAHLGIAAPKLLVANEHTEAEVASMIVARIAAGERVGFVTDAGMPGISDPGELVVRAVVDAGLAVEVIPGPSALDTALALSGLATRRFVFEGFLPRKGAVRTERLEIVAGEARTVVLYEAPHRLERTLDDLRSHCGESRRVVLCRELTKLHEESWRGTLGEAASWLEGHPPRGEYVLVVAGAEPAPPPDDEALLDALAREQSAGASTRDAATTVATHFGVSRRRVYQLATGSS